MRQIDKITEAIDRHKFADLLALNPNTAAVVLDELGEEICGDVEFDELIKYLALDIVVLPDLQSDFKLAKYLP